MRLPLTVANFFGCGSMRWGVVIANPFDLGAAALLGARRAAVDVHMVSAGFFEDAGGHELAVGIPTADPEQCRAGLECGREILAVTRCRGIVEQLLQCRAAEAGADECCDDNGDRPARQHDDAGHGQRRDVFEVVAEPGSQDFLWRPGGFVRDRERIVGGQDREVAPVELGGEQRRNGVTEMLPVGKRGDRLANDRKRFRRLGHADPRFRALAAGMLPSNTRMRQPSPPRSPMIEPSASPVMVQYHEIKQANPGCLLFFRMGDFFELFFEDAVAAAQALDIALTKRGRHDGADIPMCGVPVHTAEAYLARLIRAGFKVAICDQIEDPAEAKRRGAKMLRRAVVRVVTAGTLTEEGLLDARRHNYLAGLAEAGGEMGLAWLDLSTGAFQLAPTSEPALAGDLARLAPGEILLPERLLTRPALSELLAEWKPALTPMPNPRFESDAGRRRLQEFYGVGTLDGFGNFGRAELAAAGALVDYVGLTQQGRAPHLDPPRRLAPHSVIQIDAATRRNLELVTTLAGERKGSLLATIDRTVTAAGARLLTDHLAAPLTEPAPIAARLDAVQFFVDRPETRAALRERLRHCPDIERALTRLSLGRGGPRDLAALRQSLGETASLREML